MPKSINKGASKELLQQASYSCRCPQVLINERNDPSLKVRRIKEYSKVFILGDLFGGSLTLCSLGCKRDFVFCSLGL